VSKRRVDVESHTTPVPEDKDDLSGTARGIAYARACMSYEAITEFRGKLLALLPLATGTGAFLLLQKEDTPQNQQLLGLIGFLGFMVTVGLFTYELRGMQRCSRLEVTACQLERRLGLGEEGPFQGQPDRNLKGMLGPPAAGLIVYITTAFTWIAIALVGLSWLSTPISATTTASQATATLRQAATTSTTSSSTTSTTTPPQLSPTASKISSFRAVLLLIVYVVALAVACIRVQCWLRDAASGKPKFTCPDLPKSDEQKTSQT
jgi:hypothetical protein